jgi:hypothetical protein
MEDSSIKEVKRQEVCIEYYRLKAQIKTSGLLYQFLGQIDLGAKFKVFSVFRLFIEAKSSSICLPVLWVRTSSMMR